MRLGPALKLTFALCVAPIGAGADSPGAELIGQFEWHLQNEWFGGLSGLDVSPDGREMTVLTDRGVVFVAHIHRDGPHIAHVKITRFNRLRLQNGASLLGRTADSEGLAIAADGSLFVSFERVHRIVRYPTASAPAEGLLSPVRLRSLPYNGGIEALAIDDRDRLYAIPEDALDATRQIPVIRWDNGTWSQPFVLRGNPEFLPVGADFGPDGRLYLLERNFTVFGFRSRVRSWRITEDGAEDERLILDTARRSHDNLEAIAVWRDDSGRIRLTLVSDDNFMPFQRSEIVEYLLSEGLALRGETR